MKIADRWFERRRIDNDITLIWEPYVDSLIRCNIWHLRGAERDMVVDSGLGIASLRQFSQPLVAVLEGQLQCFDLDTVRCHVREFTDIGLD